MQAACGQRMAATASSSQSAASALLRPCRVVAVPFVATACGRQGAAACALTAACSRGGHSADRASRALLQRCAAASSTGAGDGGVTTAKPGSSGRMTYRPLTFADMVNDAVGAVQAALGNGLTRLEVEFPALPIKLDAYKGSSDVFIDSNVQLALAAAKKLAASGRKVHLLVPDDGEYQRTHRMFKASLELMDGVTIGHLKERDAKPLGGLMNILTGAGNDAPPSAAAGAAADTYLVINATCTDLLALQDYVKGWSEAEARSKALVLWNLELDTLRGDLGLPAFPSKDVHYKFLSGFRPVFFLRPREYSKSVNVAPFLVNYSGALFREYPGPWQVMIRQDNGEYACIAEDVTRYNLGELKDELMVAMGLNTEEEGSTMQLLRRGFKTSTWYEDDYDLEESHEWRL